MVPCSFRQIEGIGRQRQETIFAEAIQVRRGLAGRRPARAEDTEVSASAARRSCRAIRHRFLTSGARRMLTRPANVAGS
jgi:hypothetical protein